MKDIYGDFYNPNKALSYGRPVVISTGSRSIGKSTGWGTIAIRRFVEKNKQVVYLRRSKKGLDMTWRTWFDNGARILLDAGYDFPGVKADSHKYYIGDKQFGVAVSMNDDEDIKSINMEEVGTIVFDEFIIRPGSGKSYIGGSNSFFSEVEILSSMVTTVDRGIGHAFRDDMLVVMMGNAGSFYNPFYMAWGIDRYLRPDTKYLAPKGEFYVVEQTGKVKATEGIEKSLGYRMSTARMREYAYENHYMDTLDKVFVWKNPRGTRTPMFTMVYEGEKFGVYAYMDEGLIYICREPCSGRPAISLTTSDHRPNYMLITNWHGDQMMVMLKQMFDAGFVRVQDNRCKMVLDFYFRYDII